MSGIYCVTLIHSDDRVTFAGQDEWSESINPEFAMPLANALAKAGWWKGKSDSPDEKLVNLKAIQISACRIVPDPFHKSSIEIDMGS